MKNECYKKLSNIECFAKAHNIEIQFSTITYIDEKTDKKLSRRRIVKHFRPINGTGNFFANKFGTLLFFIFESCENMIVHEQAI